MGRPIKITKGVGIDTGYENALGLGVIGGEVDSPTDIPTIQCGFSLDGVTNLTGWIVRQKGARKFYVTDGTVYGTCVLVDKDPGVVTLGLNEMSVKITTELDGDKFLIKFNDTMGVAGDQSVYLLTFGAASAIPPAGSEYQIATVEST